MNHTFTLIYELDTTVGCAVAAYLDAEHYAFLHRKYEPDWQPLSDDGHTITVRQTWRYGIWRTGQVYTAEYVPPAQFLQYDVRPSPRWFPSIHHLVKTRTHLRYYPNEADTATVSHLEVQLDLPFFLWPLRRIIERKLCSLKREKDAEDMAMIQRRAEIYGRGNIKSYLTPHQFMLHKEEFVEHFGERAVEQPAST